MLKKTLNLIKAIIHNIMTEVSGKQGDNVKISISVHADKLDGVKWVTVY